MFKSGFEIYAGLWNFATEDLKMGANCCGCHRGSVESVKGS